MNVATFLERTADAQGDRPALIQGEQTLTYGAWRSRVGRAAGLLEGLGVGVGDRVALLMPNSIAYLESLFAVLTVGGVVVPVNTRLHPKEYAYMIEQSGSRALIYDARFRDGVASIDATADVALLQVGGAAAEAVDYGTAVEGAPDFGPAVDRRPDDLAGLFYTSGTTGRPKGAMVTHGNLDFMTRCYFEDVYPATSEDRALHAGPLTHGSGLWSFPLTAAGAAHVLPQSSSFSPDEIFALIERHRVTKLVFVSPTMIKMLIESPASDAADCSSLRFVGYGGAPIHADDLRAALERWGPVLCNIYGQVECPMTISMLTPREHEAARRSHPDRLGSVGRPRRGIELAVHGEDGEPVSAGEVGEICVRGPIVMRGYWDNAEATEDAFAAGWYRTGDLGTVDDDGFLYLLDRTKELVISGGANVYPREVENVILGLDGVRDVAVIGVPDRFWGESVLAVVVPQPGRRLTADEVIAACRDNLASYKKPRRVVFVDELPRSAYGKVLKKDLVARYAGAGTA
jgi:acyl-CoA synthetase (AMP-forming)/AMP-acid ligase II